MSFRDYLLSRRGVLIAQALQHANVVLLSVAVATVLGIAVGVATYRSRRASAIATSISAVVFTIPSFALLAFLVAPLGMGYLPTRVALVGYALLPIVRNTVAGLSGVDRSVVEVSRVMGMSRTRVLAAVELPLAWPVILAGIRLSTQLTMGIAAVTAYVGGPGLGNQIFAGLANLGGVNSLNRVLAGTLGVMVLALAADLVLVLVGRLTRPRLPQSGPMHAYAAA
jgi:osmoprotectant transport system permease protein